MNSIVRLIYPSLVILFAFTKNTVLAEVKSPPYFVQQPPPSETLFYLQSHTIDRSFEIPCEAGGIPTPDYYWKKNGEIFNWTSEGDRISLEPGKGTLKIKAPKYYDAGQYQCYAENIWGTATSNSVWARRIELHSFKDEPAVEKTAIEGQPYNLTCQPPYGYPTPNVHWIIQDSAGVLNGIKNPRITTDPTGTLWFSNVTQKDASDDSLYACSTTSSHINDVKMGCKVILEVVRSESTSHDEKQENKVAPVRQYTSKSEEVAISGTKFRLYCIFGGTPLPTITWYKNEKLLQFPKSGISLKESGKVLEMRNISTADEGTYFCEANNGVGDPLSHTTVLKVLVEPEFTEKPESVTVDEEETVQFHCQATGNPTPEIIWLYNGKPISEAPFNPRRTISDNLIVIEKLWKNDTGNYGCNATNSVGYVYQDAYVNVLAEPPNITEPPHDEEILAGDEVIIKCHAEGSPKPRITWIKDNVELTSSGDRFSSTKTGDLTIKNAQLDDMGNYVCVVQNKISSVNATMNLAVRRRTRIPPELGPSDKTVRAGGYAKFKCIALADPSLDRTITWLRNGNLVDFSSDSRFVKENDDSLYISKSLVSDSATYTCVASTRLDNATAQATLLVQDTPNPPKITSLTCNGQNAEISWMNMGDNRAPIIRYVVQYSIGSSPADIWDMGNLTVPVTETTFTLPMIPWANHTYQIMAENEIGTSAPSESFSTCSAPPDAPYKNPANVTVRATDPTTLVIAWNPMPQIDHNGPGFYYKIFWKADTPDVEWQNKTLSKWEEGEYTVRNLLPYTNYTITVIAGNDINQSTETSRKPIQGTTPPDVPFKNPDLATVEATGPTSFEVSWKPMLKTEHNGPGFHYNVSYKRDIAENEWNSIVIQSWQEGKTTVFNALPFEKYFVKIIASNDLGPARSETEPLPIEVITLPDIPYTNPTNVSARANESTIILVSWNSMPKPDQNGPGFYYNVSWKLNVPEPHWESQIIREWETTEYEIRNAKPFKKYEITVGAGNDQGQAHPVAEIVECVTPSDAPFQNPDNVTVHATTPTTLTVSWKPMPESKHNGPGFHYNVSWRRDSPEASLQSEIIPNWETHECNIQDAVPYEKYLVTVTAGNDLGTPRTTPEAPIQSTTPADIPYKNPSKVTVSSSGPTTLQLSWEPMPKIDQNGPNFYYNVSWKKDNPGAEWQSHIISEWETGQFTIPNVLPSERYIVQVTSGNEKGSAANQTKDSLDSESPLAYSTPSHIPFKNPDNVTVEATNPTNLVVRWEPMPKTEHNGPGFHYNVSWKRDSPEASWQTEIIPNWETHEYEIRDAVPYKKYLVTVTAENDLGMPQTTHEVPVECVTPADIPYKNPSNLTIHASEPTTLQLSWEPVPKVDHNGPNFYYNVSWKKDDPNAEWESHIIPEWETGHFTISNLLPNEKYLVKVTSGNERGPAVNQTDTSSPSESPSTYITPSHIPFKNPDNVTVEATNPTNLVVRWEPMPKTEHNGPGFHYNVSWKRDSPEASWQTEIIPNWETHEYEIRDAVPYKKYLVTVTAENDLGMPQTTNEVPVECITPADIPYKNPSNLTVHASEPTTLQLSWEPVPKVDHNGPNFYYNVSWKKDDPNAEWKSHVIPEWETGHFTISNLLPNEKYLVKVTSGNERGPAVNQTDTSSPSESPSTYITPSHIPFKNPDNVTVEATNPDTLVIRWEPMPKTEHNGPDFYYNVLWKMDSPEADWKNHIISEWETGEYTASVLPYEKYLIKVVAGNAQGESIQLPIMAEAQYEEEVPLEAPKNLKLVEIISPTSAKVSWNRVPKAALRGNFQKYKIESWPEHDEQKNKVITYVIKRDSDNAIIDKLTTNTKNKIRISVFNGKYQSPYSEELEIDTPEGVPEPVQLLEAKPLGSSALSLAWKPPLKTNGYLTGYRIYYQEVLGTELGPLKERIPQITDPEQTRAKLLDLEPDTKYRIHIKATTNAGEGETFLIEQKTPPPSSSPIQPDFQIIPIEQANSTTSKVKIVWLPCGTNDEKTNKCDEQSIGSEFRVDYKLKGDFEFQTAVEKDKNDVIIGDLQPNQEYEFVVSSIDGRQETKSGTKSYGTANTPKQDKQVLPPSKIFETLPTSSTTVAKKLVEDTTNDSLIGWIAVILAIVILIIVLILIVIYLKYLTEGGKYDVWEKENQNRRPGIEDEDLDEVSSPLNLEAPESDREGMAMTPMCSD